MTLIVLTGFSPLSLNMFMPSLNSIAVDLQTDYATVSWTVSGYLAITAMIQLIIGPLSDRIGRRPVLLVAVFLFACASVGCMLAQDIWTFLFFRMFQGGMTAGYTLSLAIDYPQTDDLTRAAAGGYSPGGDIFIHGQPNRLPDARVIAGDWTAGCIAVSNAEMREIWAVTPIGTTVEIRG